MSSKSLKHFQPLFFFSLNAGKVQMETKCSLQRSCVLQLSVIRAFHSFLVVMLLVKLLQSWVSLSSPVSAQRYIYVRLQSLPPPKVTEIILQNVVILPSTSSFKSSSGLAHFTPALKVCFMSLVNIIAGLIGWILASSVHNGFTGEDEVRIQEALPHKRVKRFGNNWS